MATKACGGGTSDLGYFLEVCVFIGEVGIENKSGGPTGSPRGTGARPRGVGAPSTLVDGSGLFSSISDAPWASSGPEMISVNFQVNWTSFDIPFLRYSKTRRKQKLALGSRLIG